MFEKLFNILKFKSDTPDKSSCQLYIGKIFKKIGFQIFTMKYKNTNNSIFIRYSKKKEKKIDIAFLGHTDVVPFKEKRISFKRNNIYSRGIVDMKGSIFCFYKAVKFSIKKKVNKTIAIVLSGDEEGKAKYGVKELIRRIKKKIKIKNCIIGEPTSKNEIGDTLKTKRRGSYNFKIVIKCKKKHNAYYKNKTFNKIKYLLDFFNKENINVYNIKTNNNKTNIIPGKTTIYLNYRYEKEKKLTSSIKKISVILNKHNVKGLIKKIQDSKPYKSSSDEFCKNILKIMHKENIKTNINNKTGGTSDGRYMKDISKNIVELGLKNKYAHRDNEKARIEDVFNLINIYYKILILKTMSC
ncbi:N-succinyl-L L-diaminopimelate desuccinylase [Candidatus Vidania fulgoroideae]|nr:N-succinyl-L L-diaminopimelate desuccinylase [Candidatus Vidania fulgoroideae]